MTDRVLLLDGHSLAYRAFFALPQTIATTTGQITNAVYGFTSMLLKLLAEQKTDRIGVAFDLGRPTARLAEYAEYKAGRRETPNEFRQQLALLREVLDALRVPVFEVEEQEADDVIASLARRAAEEGLEAVIVTADRDFLQLVGPGVSVLFNRRGVTEYTWYDRAAVEERFGLPPDKLVDFVALKGDPSDNLPGVPGIGDKTASLLVQEFGSVEGLYESLDRLPKRLAKLRPALEAARQQVLQNKTLARLVDTLPVDIDPAEIRMREWDPEEVRKLFLTLEFRSLLERLPDARPSAPPEAAEEVTARVGGIGDVEAIAARARAAGRVALAWPEDGEGLALAVSDDEAVWLDDRSRAHALLCDPGVPKVAHDGKALASPLARAGAAVGGLSFDTQIAAYLLDPAPGRYPLEEVSRRYLGRELPSMREAESGQLSFGVEESDAAGAACARAAALLPLADRLAAELERRGMTELFRDVEMPLVDVLVELERNGIAVDTGLLAAMGNTMSTQIRTLEDEIHRHAGGPFNINSPPQLRQVLYDRLQLAPSRRTKTGYSTDAQALEGLVGLHPIVEAILRYRELTKLKSTYLDALPPLVDPATGRLHATFKQTATATGRISTEAPNLQNIPVRGEIGREIRKAFIAGLPGHALLVADYSQIELRVLAHITGDPGLREAFENDLDVHSATAAKIWGFAVDEVPRDLRNRAKAVNFGLAYGMNAYGLAQRLGITPDEAQEFIDAYFREFPNVREFMQSVVRDAYRDGYTMTLLGRRRYIPELTHRNLRVRSLGERQALNAPIQGSAADIIKLAMIKVHRGLGASGLRARMVLTVHDELLFEVPDEDRNETKDAIRSLMEQAYPLEVPLKVDVAIGSSWADAKG